MTYIYRIETTEGGGLYNSELGRLQKILSQHLSRKDSSRFYQHPCPEEDSALDWHEIKEKTFYINGRYYKKEHWYFGVATLKEVNKWVFRKKYRKVLADLGFVISKYKIEDGIYRDTCR